MSASVVDFVFVNFTAVIRNRKKSKQLKMYVFQRTKNEETPAYYLSDAQMSFWPKLSGVVCAEIEKCKIFWSVDNFPVKK